MKSYRFENGDLLPALGLGTWKSDPGDVRKAVEAAIRIGYRHIDCAPIYGNEHEVGEAVKACIDEGLVRREELWITSKLWNDAHAPGDVEPALDRTLGDLGLTYLDLYLIHWPIAHEPGVSFPQKGSDLVALDELPIATTWAAMESLVERGKCRHIGVSNFGVPKLEQLLRDATRIKPEVDQVELHPYLQQPELLERCRSSGVHVTAYSPLGSKDRPSILKQEEEPVLLEDPVILDIAERRGATPAQVLIAWALQRGTSVIPKSVNPKRIEENFRSAELELDAEEVERIRGLDRQRRYVDGTIFELEGGPFTADELWNA